MKEELTKSGKLKVHVPWVIYVQWCIELYVASYTCTCVPQTSRIAQMLGMYGYDSAECVALLLRLYDLTV